MSLPRTSRRLNFEDHHHTAATDCRMDQHHAAALGYQDAAYGRGFSRWYETASENHQLAYEVGRHWATNQRAAGIKPPAWCKVGPPPQAVQQANVLAAERGEAYATPYGVFPDTDDPVTLEPFDLRLIRRRRRR